MASKPNLSLVIASVLGLLALCGIARAEPNLVSWWEFDEGGGITAFDSAGDYDGTVYGATWTSGQIDGALDFDGDGDYVDFGDIDEFEFGDANFTISAWFYTQGPHSAYDGYGDVVGKYNYGGDGRQWVIYQDPNGRIDFYTNPTGQLATNEHLWSNDGYQSQWTHIVAVRNGSTKVLYVDGAADNTGATAGVVTGKSSKVYVGCRENPSGRGYFFNGIIDDVRVYNRALSAEEVSQLYQEGSGGLVAHWKFDEGEGTTAYDSVGTNDGTIYGASWMNGILDGALYFDSYNDYVSIGAVTLSTSWTVSGWFEPLPNGVSPCNPIMGGPGTYYNYIILCEQGNDIALETNTEGDFTRVCRGVVAFNEWGYYTVTRNGNSICGYKNGTFIDEGVLPTGDDNTITRIASGYGMETYYKGRIDDVRIYDRALSAEEVSQLYQGDGGGLIAHWEFDEGEGTTAYDSAGDNDGTIYGAEWTGGQIGGGLSFDGVDDYVVSSSNITISGDAERSVSFWAKTSYLTDYANCQPVVKWGDNSIHRHLNLITFGNIGGHVNFIGQYADVHGEVDLLSDTWTHVVVTYDGTTLRIFVDGSLDVAGDVTLDTSESLMTVGYFVSGWEYFEGTVDDLRIYDRALSAEEIQQIYEDGLPRIAVDIRPGSCPNPLNLKSSGILPVAVLGTEEFDVGNVDPVSVRLAGVAAIRHGYEDVAGAVVDGNECECATEGADGHDDLTLKFRTQEIVRELIDAPGELANGQTLALTLTGELFDGTSIQGADCVILVGNVPKWLAAQRWDANADGIVNMFDLAEFANYWLESSDAQ